MRAKQPRTLPYTTDSKRENIGFGLEIMSARACDSHLRRSFRDIKVRRLAGCRQPLYAADEKVVLHGVEVEGIAVAVERNVKVTRDNFARQHEVGVGGGRGLRL